MDRNNAIAVSVVIALLVLMAVLAYFASTPQRPGQAAVTGSTTVAHRNWSAAALGPGRNTIVLGAVGTYMNSSRMAQVKGYGIRWIRTDIYFNPQFWAYMANLSSNGFGIIGILDYDTVGAKITGAGCAANCSWTLGNWSQSVSSAVGMYPYVHVWEIWNEPQIQRYQDGFYNGSTYNYYQMAKSAYQIIKAHNASDIVLCLGGANLYIGGAGPSAADYQWSQQLWGYGAASYCDAISLHAYSGFQYLLNQTPQGGSQTMGSIFNSTIGYYENLTGKPIWITEIGIPSGVNASYTDPFGSSLQKQAAFLNQSYSLMLSKPYVRALVWYKVYGYNNPPYNIDFGLFYPNMTPKPAYAALMRFHAPPWNAT